MTTLPTPTPRPSLRGWRSPPPPTTPKANTPPNPSKTACATGACTGSGPDLRKEHRRLPDETAGPLHRREPGAGPGRVGAVPPQPGGGGRRDCAQRGDASLLGPPDRPPAGGGENLLRGLAALGGGRGRPRAAPLGAH